MIFRDCALILGKLNHQLHIFGETISILQLFTVQTQSLPSKLIVWPKPPFQVLVPHVLQGAGLHHSNEISGDRTDKLPACMTILCLRETDTRTKDSIDDLLKTFWQCRHLSFAGTKKGISFVKENN